MRPVLITIIVAAVLGWFASPSFAREAAPAVPHAHKHLTTTIEKIESGLMWFNPVAGSRHRAVSLHKAERMGLHEAKPGDEVILVIDENNLLIDLHRSDLEPAGHRLVAGELTYADPFWEVIEITNADGNKTYAMDEATGSKLSMLEEGRLVRAELNEDNMVVDIYVSH